MITWPVDATSIGTDFPMRGNASTLPAREIMSAALPARAVSSTTLPATSVQTLVASGALGSRRIQSAWRPAEAPDLPQQLNSRLFDLKLLASKFAMHMDADWRRGFFGQLDFLLDEENWEPIDELPKESSFTTAVRLLMFFGKVRRPGLGLTPNGNIVLAWTSGQDKLTIECQANDQVRWIVSHHIAGLRESAAGISTVLRLPSIIAAYEPEKWLANP